MLSKDGLQALLIPSCGVRLPLLFLQRIDHCQIITSLWFCLLLIAVCILRKSWWFKWTLYSTAWYSLRVSPVLMRLHCGFQTLVSMLTGTLWEVSDTAWMSRQIWQQLAWFAVHVCKEWGIWRREMVFFPFLANWRKWNICWLIWC